MSNVAYLKMLHARHEADAGLAQLKTALTQARIEHGDRAAAKLIIEHKLQENPWIVSWLKQRGQSGLADALSLAKKQKGKPQ